MCDLHATTLSELARAIGNEDALRRLAGRRYVGHFDERFVEGTIMRDDLQRDEFVSAVVLAKFPPSKNRIVYTPGNGVVLIVDGHTCVSSHDFAIK